MMANATKGQHRRIPTGRPRNALRVYLHSMSRTVAILAIRTDEVNGPLVAPGLSTSGIVLERGESSL